MSEHDDGKPYIDLSNVPGHRHIPSRFDAGRTPAPVDPTPQDPLSRGRARRLPPMGEQPKLPSMMPERVEVTDNPMSAAVDPVSIATERPIARPDYGRTTVRRVVHAELDEMIAWGMPRFLRRFPRCTAQAMWPFLADACNGGPYFFCRTDNACGLFVAMCTPEEPEIAVIDKFVVKKREAANDEERDAIYRAGLEWAKSINAVSFTYGSSTGVRLDGVAEKIGHDIINHSYTKILR
jgi:hypothetical protein